MIKHIALYKDGQAEITMVDFEPCAVNKIEYGYVCKDSAEALQRATDEVFVFYDGIAVGQGQSSS